MGVLLLSIRAKYELPCQVPYGKETPPTIYEGLSSSFHHRQTELRYCYGFPKRPFPSKCAFRFTLSDEEWQLEDKISKPRTTMSENLVISHDRYNQAWIPLPGMK